MYKGTIRLEAKMTDNCIGFAPFEFKPSMSGVERFQIATEERTICVSVDVSSVSTPDDGVRLALAITETALNRLAFVHQIALPPAKVTSREFTSMSAGPGHVAVLAPAYITVQGHVVDLVVGLSLANIKAALEPAALPGEQNFGSIRSARNSVGAVEEFMHLYAILLGFFGDKQNDVDAFIVSVDQAVPQTQSPIKAGAMETIYTRLRNELAHRRPGVDIDSTKQQMAARVGDLRGLVKEAIQRYP